MITYSENLRRPPSLSQGRALQRVLLIHAGKVTHLLSYVSLNLTAVRKILKKMAKHIRPEAPTPGYLSLDIRHPHNPGYRLVQVCPCCRESLISSRLLAMLLAGGTNSFILLSLTFVLGGHFL